MALVEGRLRELGLTLPPELERPAGLRTPFTWARRYGDRLYVSGHGPQAEDGTLAGPFGRVPSTVSLEAAQEAAHRTALSLLASVRRAIGDLDRVSAWLVVRGSVNADPGFTGTTSVLNPFSDLIIELYGPEVGSHARTVAGVSALPLDVCLVVSAELAVSG